MKRKCESLIPVAGTCELVIPLIRWISRWKMERSAKREKTAGLEQVQNETVSVAANYILRSSVPCGDEGNAGVGFFMPENGSILPKVEAEEYVDVVRSGTPVRARVESEGFTCKQAVNHASVSESSGVVGNSGLPLCKFLSQFQSALPFLYRLTFWSLSNSLQDNPFRAQSILELAS